MFLLLSTSIIFSGRCNKLLAKNSQQCWPKGFIFRVQTRVEISFVISILALKLVELPDSWIGDSSLGMKIHGKNKQCPYFNENWPGTQSKGQYTRASWLKGGFSLVNELEITLPDFTVLPSVDTGGKSIYFRVCITSLLDTYSLCIARTKQSLFTLKWKDFRELSDLQKYIVLTLQLPKFYPVLIDSRPRKCHWCD